jgi:hypothetical protein
MKLYMFWAFPLLIIRSLFTVHSALVCHTAFEQDQDGTMEFHPGPARKLFSNVYGTMEFHPAPARKLYSNLYDIYHGRVYSE